MLALSVITVILALLAKPRPYVFAGLYGLLLFNGSKAGRSAPDLAVYPVLKGMRRQLVLCQQMNNLFAQHGAQDFPCAVAVNSVSDG